MTTTTKTRDYLNEPLINDDPGTSDATDAMGRSVGENDTDYMGRDLKE